MKFKVYKEKFAICRAFYPLLALSIIPFIKNGFTPMLVIQTGINSLLILISFSELAVRKIPNAYCMGLLILGMMMSYIKGCLLEHVLYGVGILFAMELTVVIMDRRRKNKDGKHVSGGGDSKFYALSGLLLGYDSLFAIVAASLLQIFHIMIRKSKTKRIILGPYLAVSIYLFMMYRF